jgi:phosphopantothenoylcysteine decarboxylase / phosphopantothenate---cysteine ligase
MESWLPGPPRSTSIGDHDAPPIGHTLAGRRVALLVTGGIAAYRAPSVARALRRLGASVVPFVTPEGRRYVGVEALEWACNATGVTDLTFRAEHLGDAAPFDAYLVAPATYNTINSLRAGIASNPVLAVLASALGRLRRGEAAVLLAPTMHGTMHTDILQENLLHLRAMGVTLVPPVDRYGKHNLPAPETLAAWTAAACSRSPLRGRRIVVTAGSIPTWIDDVRVMTNLFRGRLGIRIAEELAQRGADVQLIIGPTAETVPPYVATTRVRSFDEYRAAVLRQSAVPGTACHILSAAVADYRVRTKLAGKIPSTGLDRLDLTPTAKVVTEVIAQFPDVPTVSFKFQLDMAHEALIRIAEDRLREGHFAVIANRGEERGPGGEQIAHLVTRDAPPKPMMGKPEIASILADYLEARIAGGPT